MRATVIRSSIILVMVLAFETLAGFMVLPATFLAFITGILLYDFLRLDFKLAHPVNFIYPIFTESSSNVH